MDYYNDNGHLFAKIFHLMELPSFAKEGSYLDSVSELPAEAFGDEVRRMFPCHDRANTYVSYAYAYAQRDQKVAEEALSKIKTAAQMFGIDGDLSVLEVHIDSLHNKTAAVSTPEWEGKMAAFSIDFNAPLVKTVQGAGAENAKRACDRFFGIYPSIDLNHRTKVAEQLITACEENGVEVSPDLLKFAGRAESDAALVQEQFNLRLAYITDSLDKTAATKELHELWGRDNAISLGELGKLDEKYKLARFYGRGLLDPHRAVYNMIPQKLAMIEVGKKAYPMERWTVGKENFTAALQAAFGNEKAASLIVDGQPKLDGLTDDEAKLLNSYLG